MILEYYSLLQNTEFLFWCNWCKAIDIMCEWNRKKKYLAVDDVYAFIRVTINAHRKDVQIKKVVAAKLHQTNSQYHPEFMHQTSSAPWNIGMMHSKSVKWIICLNSFNSKLHLNKHLFEWVMCAVCVSKSVNENFLLCHRDHHWHVFLHFQGHHIPI